MTGNRDDAAVGRAHKLWEAVRDGMVVFFRAGNSWDIIGPAHLITPGAEVTVTKADKTTETVTVGTIVAERTIDGVDTRTATFTRPKPAVTAPAPAPAHVVVPWTPVRDITDRQAATVAAMLGRTPTSPTGSCHYCGLQLDPKGNCAECV